MSNTRLELIVYLWSVWFKLTERYGNLHPAFFQPLHQLFWCGHVTGCRLFQYRETLSKYYDTAINFNLPHTLNLSGRLLKNYYSTQGANSS